MHENPSSQGHLRGCRWGLVVPRGQAGVLAVAAALLASCVNLSYPPGASRDGGGQALVAHLGNGRVCKANADCASGHCADGVCCKTECADNCYSCALTGNEGVCMPAPVG